MNSELSDSIRAITADKGISSELVQKVVEEFLLAAYKKVYGTSDNAVVKFGEDLGEVSISAKKVVVEDDDLYDPVGEIELKDAKELNEEATVGDEILIEIDPLEFDRSAVHTAKQRAKQYLRDIQKDTLYSEFSGKENEVIIGYYQRERNGNIFVDLGRTEGILPKRNQSPRETYGPGSRIKSLISEVKKTPGGLQVVLSRRDPKFVEKLFELEVPEIYEKTILIHKIVREAGYRTKIAVRSVKEEVDPIGACVGLKGVRIQAVISEVKKTPGGLQVVLSRRDPKFVEKLFELEVPEIYEKTILIHKIVREAGYRTKIAVRSVKEEVDPIGACVGLKGVRIQAVMKELEGERIDVLKWDPEPREFIRNALNPAQVDQIIILDEQKKQALAVVPESQLSLAIGKQGLNVKLANRLCDWSIDVKTQEQFAEMDLSREAREAAHGLFRTEEEAEGSVITEVRELEGISERLVDLLAEHNVMLIETLVNMGREDLAKIPNITAQDVETLMKVIEDNVEIVEEQGAEAPIDYSPEDTVEYEEEFECPECGAPVQINMTQCPSCGVGLSFEIEEEEAEEK